MYRTVWVCSVLAALICYLPFILNFDISQSGYNSIEEIPLREALTSTVFAYSLVASIASAVPMALELFADSFTAGFSLAPANQFSVFSKWLLLAALIIPNIFILTIVVPESYYEMIPMIFLSRQILLFPALMTFVSHYGSPIWTNNSAAFLIITFTVGQTINLFQAYTFPKWESLDILRLITVAIFSSCLIFLTCRWLYMIKKKIFIEKSTLTVDEYFCTGHLFAMLLGFLGFGILYILYNSYSWAQTDGLYLASYSYIEVAYTIVLSIWNGRIARREFALMQARLELETKRLFVRYVSHEIRTPLNTVVMGLRLLHAELSALEEVDIRSQVDTVVDLTVSCDTAVDILNDLLTYEKLSSNILTLELSVVALKKFINESTRPFFLQAREAGIVLEIVFCGVLLPDDTEVLLKLDKSKIAQVIRNLISNALKFTKRGGRVRVLLSRVASPLMQAESPDAEGPNSFTERMRALFTASVAATSMHRPASLESTQHPVATEAIEREPVPAEQDTDAFNGYEVFPSTADIDSTVIIHDSRMGTTVVNSGDGGYNHSMIAIRNESMHGTGTQSNEVGISLIDRPLSAARAVDSRNDMDLESNMVMEEEVEGDLEGEGEGWLRVDVVDTGPGISKENQKLLFNEIVQFNPGELQDGKGSGLGLWISRRIVDLHGGGLFVNSEGLGCGSTFTVTLPILEISKSSGASLEQPVPVSESNNSATSLNPSSLSDTQLSTATSTAAMTTVTVASPATHRRRHSHTQQTLAMLQGFSLLLVDDAALNRKFLRKLLVQRCKFLREAEDGMQALQTVHSSLGESATPIDLIVIDYQMPVMDGPTAVKEMKLAGYRGIIIGLTGNALPSDIQFFMSSGADRVLIKPLRFEELISALAEILEERLSI